MRVQACCLFASELLLLSMCKLSCFPDHFLLVDTPLKNAPQPDFDESVCITQFGSFCLLTSAKEVPVLTDCLILSLPGISKPGLVIVFVVVEIT